MMSGLDESLSSKNHKLKYDPDYCGLDPAEIEALQDIDSGKAE